MKVALCLHGYFDSFSDRESKGIDGFKHIKKNILDKANVDIFIHSWDVKNEGLIRNSYEKWIKRIKLEFQEDFSPLIQQNEIHKTYLNPGYVKPQSVFSHFASIQRSFELMKETEIKYDCVIKARFDLGRINRRTSGPGLMSPYPVQCISFNPELSMNNLYMANWQHIHTDGPADMWFYSNYENMLHFTQIFEHIKSQLKFNSDYYNNSDKVEFTNTIRLYRYFLQKVGLWDKKVLLDSVWE